MDYFSVLEDILHTSVPKDKIEKFRLFYNNFLNNDYIMNESYTPYTFDKPSYYTFLEIIKPTALPVIKNFKSIEGKKYLVHTILHIEYSAIDLALDAALRFKDMPKKYYEDWLEVADDEIRHFLMLEELLTELEGVYGDFLYIKIFLKQWNKHLIFYEEWQPFHDILKQMGLTKIQKLWKN